MEKETVKIITGIGLSAGIGMFIGNGITQFCTKVTPLVLKVGITIIGLALSFISGDAIGPYVDKKVDVIYDWFEKKENSEFEF